MNAATLSAAGTHEYHTRLRRRALRADGVFLLGVGAVQMVFELLGHFAGAGPLAAVFSGNGAHFTIGFFEAHGLAAIFGVLLLDAGTAAHDAHWHGAAAAIHALLGGANLLFWPSFVALGLVPMGVVATAFHLGFVALQVTCASLVRFQVPISTAMSAASHAIAAQLPGPEMRP